MKIFSRKKIIDALFLIFLIVSISLEFKNVLFDEIPEIYNLDTISMVKYTLMCFIVAIFIVVINRCFIIFPYLFYKVYTKKYFKEKINVKTFSKNKNYYRNIIEDYSPAVLSYIDDFQLDYPKDIVAVLLNLKRKKKIDEFNLDPKNTNTINCNNYNNSEDYILKNYQNNTLNLVFEKTKDIIIKEAISLGLIEESRKIKEKNKKRIKMIVIFYLILFIIFIITSVLGNLFFSSNENFLLYIMIYLVFMLLFIPLILIFYIFPLVKVLNIYVRTEKGEEIHKKLEGLKNYLKDFSRLDEKNSKEIMLWDSYLVYSVIFNQNENIIKEIEKKLFYL